jgi:N-acetylmuramoyl-L-alanine amidase CwlA
MAVRNVFLKRKASADFAVDDATIVQINPDLKNNYTWSVGDAKNPYSGGGQLYGQATNKNTISIEICSNLKPGTSSNDANHEGWYYTDAAVQNAIKLVKYLMQVYNVPKERVVRHYDISGKLCPGIIGWNNGPLYDTKGNKTNNKNNSAKWEKFKSLI